MNEEERLSRLKKRISTMRRKLHVLFNDKQSFTDPEVYHLSQQLDSLITEYQKSIWKRNE